MTQKGKAHLFEQEKNSKMQNKQWFLLNISLFKSLPMPHPHTHSFGKQWRTSENWENTFPQMEPRKNPQFKIILLRFINAIDTKAIRSRHLYNLTHCSLFFVSNVLIREYPGCRYVVMCLQNIYTAQQYGVVKICKKGNHEKKCFWVCGRTVVVYWQTSHKILSRYLYETTLFYHQFWKKHWRRIKKERYDKAKRKKLIHQTMLIHRTTTNSNIRVFACTKGYLFWSRNPCKFLAL